MRDFCYSLCNHQQSTWLNKNETTKMSFQYLLVLYFCLQPKPCGFIAGNLFLTHHLLTKKVVVSIALYGRFPVSFSVFQ